MTKEQKLFLPIMNALHNGTPEEINEAKVQALDLLDKFITKTMNKNFGSFRSKFEDLQQEGRLAVLDHLSKYDPTKHAPTTFFYIHIFHAMNEYLHDDKGISAYYRKDISKLEEAERILIEKGKPVTRANLSIETGFKEDKIIRTMQVHNVTNVKYLEEMVSPDEHIANQSQSPETIVIQHEGERAINMALDALSELEFQIIEMHFYKEYTFQKIANELHLDLRVVRRTYNHAIDKLRNNKNILRAHGERKKLRVKQYSARRLAVVESQNPRLEKIASTAIEGEIFFG